MLYFNFLVQGEDSECLSYLAQYLSDEFQNKRDQEVRCSSSFSSYFRSSPANIHFNSNIDGDSSHHTTAET